MVTGGDVGLDLAIDLVQGLRQCRLVDPQASICPAADPVGVLLAITLAV